MKFRFTIRDLLWLTLVVALTVGWWIDHSRTADIRDKAAAFDEMQKSFQSQFDEAIQKEISAERAQPK